jgi:hypothetical protein
MPVCPKAPDWAHSTRTSASLYHVKPGPHGFRVWKRFQDIGWQMVGQFTNEADADAYVLAKLNPNGCGPEGPTLPPTPA